MNITIIKKQLPGEKELVLVKIKKIMPHGAYVELTEYSKDAYLPISEIASGWIKNIHEFIKEGQKTVGKVLSVDLQKGSIDVSLKKATAKEKADKLNEHGIEKRYEKLFEQAVKLSEIVNENDVEALKTEIAKKVPTYIELINNTLEDEHFTDFLKNKAFSKAFNEILEKNIKPRRFEVSYLVELKSNNPIVGISTLKESLNAIKELGVGVLYLGAPRYRLTAEDASYPTAEEKIKKARKILESYAKKITFTMKNEKHD